MTDTAKRKFHRLAVHEFQSNGITATAYSMRCFKCKVNRQMSYQGGQRARCVICGHEHRVWPLFPHPTAPKGPWKATEEQIAQAKAEYAKRYATCRKYAREAFLAQDIRRFSILEYMEAMGLPNYDEILREIVTSPRGLTTPAHTPETLRQGAYHQSFNWYGQGIRRKQGEDAVPQY